MVISIQKFERGMAVDFAPIESVFDSFVYCEQLRDQYLNGTLFLVIHRKVQYIKNKQEIVNFLREQYQYYKLLAIKKQVIQNKKMDKKKVLSYLPYVLLIIANFVYLLANGLKPMKAHPQLIMYNVIFFILVGIVIMIKVNLLLHSWFIKEEGQVKNKTKTAIKKISDMVEFGLSIFKKGNQRMMIRIFFYLNLWIMVNKYVPGFLLGVLVGTYFQYKGVLQEILKNQIKELNQLGDKIINHILQKTPRYSSQKQKKNL